jgi:cell division protein ZipA
MDTLRWILLIFGLILIGAVYFTGRRRQPDSSRRREPELEAAAEPLDAADEEDSEASGMEEAAEGDQEDAFDFERLLADVDVKDTATPAPPRAQDRAAHYSMLLEDEFVVIHLTAAAGVGVSGSRLYSTLDELGFEPGRDAIFHYRESGCPLIVVNMFKPGTFPSDPEDFVSKGISLILKLSRAPRPLEAFDQMVTLAYELKSMLNLQLFDMQRSSLTRQTIAFLEEEIADYQRRRGT